MLPLDPYFCCLRPLERAVFRQVGAWFILTTGLPMPFDVWLSYWATAGAALPEYSNTFAALYGLRIVTIDGVDVVEFVDTFLWAEVGVFILTPAAACAAGCLVWYPS